uniref:Uncharacterized protein n=1 Tax=Rhizophora mucronata TaxID=61149 RepID=A0A2P2PU54_RHIMU
MAKKAGNNDLGDKRSVRALTRDHTHHQSAARKSVLSLGENRERGEGRWDLIVLLGDVRRRLPLET